MIRAHAVVRIHPRRDGGILPVLLFIGFVREWVRPDVALHSRSSAMVDLRASDLMGLHAPQDTTCKPGAIAMW
jgi:hypothetical protein